MGNGKAQRVAIVTDSSCDIPPQLLAQYGIHVAPLILIMGNRTWLDGVDIDAATFYEVLKTSSDFPSSSQPTVADFMELFTRVSQEADAIVAVLVSSEISGTINSARAAAENLPDLPIEIVDSRSVSMELGFSVLAAARAAAAGAGPEAVADAARDVVSRSQMIFIVDTLEYLHRGGRIGAAAWIFGSALNLKPILEFRDGIVAPLTRVRTRRKSLDKTFELIEAQLSEAGQIHMSVINAACCDEAAEYMARLEQRFNPVEMIEAECGPVVGTHAGPGTIGIAFYAE